MFNKTSTIIPSLISNPYKMDLNYSIFKLFFVLFLRGGSLLVQLGTFPTDNVYNIISQNIIDIAVTVTSFVSIGFPLISNFHKFNYFFGYGTWIGSEEADVDSAINGLSVALLSTHIITSLLSGRLHPKASIIVYSIFSGITLPITMQFAWSENSWMKENSAYGTKVSFHDYAGGVVIHCASGIVGLIGSLCLGRRILRLKDISPASLSIESLGTIFLGYIFIFFGIISTFFPKNSDSDMDVKLSIINCSLVLSLSISILILLIMVRYSKIEISNSLQAFQGGIAALVMLASGIDQYSVYTGLIIAIVSSILFMLTTTLINSTPLEDYCSIISTHVINGFVAMLIPKICTTFPEIHWQIFCALIIITLQTVVFSAVFSLLAYFGILSNESESVNHKRAMILVRSTRTTRCSRIFQVEKNAYVLQPGEGAKKLKMRRVDAVCERPSSVSVATNTSGNTKEEDSNTNDRIVFVGSSDETVELGLRDNVRVVIKEKKGKVRKGTGKEIKCRHNIGGEGQNVNACGSGDDEVHKLQDLMERSEKLYQSDNDV